MIRCNYTFDDGITRARHTGFIGQAEKDGVKGWQLFFEPGLLPAIFRPDVHDVVNEARRLSVGPNELDVMSVEEALMVWPFVAQSLAFEGTAKKYFTEAELAHAYRLCNGFGAAPPAEYDWSHVRDSSACAVRTVGEYLRCCLNARGYQLFFPTGGGFGIRDMHEGEFQKIIANLQETLATLCRRRQSLAAHLFTSPPALGETTVAEVRRYGEALLEIARSAEDFNAERAARGKVSL